jgi:hypothetical protein
MSEGQSTDIFWIIPPSSFMSSITIECVSDGLIEVAWYIPSGKAKNFSNITMVLNLRGDCKDHQPQLDFLSAISSVVDLEVDNNILYTIYL